MVSWNKLHRLLQSSFMKIIIRVKKEPTFPKKCLVSCTCKNSHAYVTKTNIQYNLWSRTAKNIFADPFGILCPRTIPERLSAERNNAAEPKVGHKNYMVKWNTDTGSLNFGMGRIGMIFTCSLYSLLCFSTILLDREFLSKNLSKYIRLRLPFALWENIHIISSYLFILTYVT